MIAAAATLQGCVVWEIRDGVEGVNARLDSVEETLESVNSELTDIEVQLADVSGIIDQTNQHLAVVQGDLGTTKSSLGSVDTSLGSVDEQLRLLREIEGSLSRLDTHLASLRKTINRIDGAIPFLSFGGDEVIEPPPVDTAETSSGSEDDQRIETAEALPPNALPPSTARADPIVGVWVSVHAEDGIVLVLDTDKSFNFVRPAGDGSRERLRGMWSQRGATLTLESDDESRDFEILLQTTRTLTLDEAGERIFVLTKP